MRGEACYQSMFFIALFCMSNVAFQNEQSSGYLMVPIVCVVGLTNESTINPSCCVFYTDIALFGKSCCVI